MNDNHIASAFDRDLEGIQAKLMRMGGMVEQAIQGATKALLDRNPDLAAEVRMADKKIDALDESLQADCARLIALRQPIASDLRTVLSVMRIVSHLERTGDYSKNMAKRTGAILDLPEVKGAAGAIARMSRQVESMLSDSLNAFVQNDAKLAEDVRQRDVEVDEMYVAIFRELITFMLEDPRTISAAMHYHFIAKNLERMGDHVVAITAQTIYHVTGELPSEPREKGTSKIYDPETIQFP